MNHPCFLRQLRSQNTFKISDRLKTFDVKPLPKRTIIVKQYQCKKTLKTIPSKQRLQQYMLTTVSDQSFVFLELKQSPPSHQSAFTLSQRQFVENNFLTQIIGQMTQVSQEQYVITGFQWDGFVIEFISFSEDVFLFIITNQMVSNMVKKFQQRDLQFKIKLCFEEVLSRIINQKKATQLIDNYLQQLKKLFDKHPQLINKTNDEQKLINFNLIKYQKINEINQQQNKLKFDEEKRDKPSNQMDIQK